MKKRMITGVTPSGSFTIGNYIGAINNFVKLQKEYDSYIFIADLHAVTSYIDPKEINRNIKELVCLYLACGIDPKYTKFFIQSEIPEHGELGYIISFQCRVGELSRMTQYKSKTQKLGKNGIDLGLFIYPTLMAADILMYDAEIVPVGKDQQQHIEITRDLGERFNKRFGTAFKLPNYYTSEVGGKILNLKNPEEKMSKSAPSEDKGTIFILDDLEVIKGKVLSAVTDSENKVYYDAKNKPGISNLLTIVSVITGTCIKELEIKYANYNYKDFKMEVAKKVCEFIKPIQEKYNYYFASKEVKEILGEGKEKALIVCKKKIEIVRNKMGMYYKK